MTTPSEQQQLEQQIADSLNQSVAHMAGDKIADIAQVRKHALAQASKKTRVSDNKKDELLGAKIKSWFAPQVLVPVSLAVCLAVLVNYQSVDNPVPSDFAHVQPLPIEVFDESIPTEDIALLQDLEFAHWLANQIQEINAEEQSKEVVL